MTVHSVDLLEKYWFAELGCSKNQVIRGKTIVSAHGTLSGYWGVVFFKHRDACVASVPRFLIEELRGKLAGVNIGKSFDSEFIRAVLGARLDRVIGPAWIGQLRAENYKPSHGTESKTLTEADWPDLRNLLEVCTTEEAEYSALVVGRIPTIGVFSCEKLVAAASYEILSGQIAHIGVLTHPAYRGRGFAKNAISALVQIALNAKLGMQYQTLCSNVASIRAAESLGFETFAETIAARIR